MNERKPYTVENIRPRRMVRLPGRTLAPAGTGRTSFADLAEDELLSPAIVRLAGRLKLVRAPAIVPAAVADLWALPEGSSTVPASAEDTIPAAAEELDHAEAEDAVEEAPEEAPEEGASEGNEDGDEDGDDGDPDSVEAGAGAAGAGAAGPADDGGDADPLTDTSHVWTEAELFALNAADQKTILRSRGLKQTGKEEDRVTRILEAQD